MVNRKRKRTHCMRGKPKKEQPEREGNRKGNRSGNGGHQSIKTLLRHDNDAYLKYNHILTTENNKTSTFPPLDQPELD